MLTIKDELIAYATDCLSGKEAACKKHKWACERFLADIRKEADGTCAYSWDEAEAANIVDWFGLLKHSKGILSGEFIQLTVWQKFFLCQIYGWRREDGTKRFRRSFIEVARKNAKSQMEAGCILYEMSTQAVKNNEIYECYCAGVKRDQSKLIFEECKNLLKGSPLITKFKLTRDAITHVKTGSFLKPLCKEDGRKGDGTNPAILVLDEYQDRNLSVYA